MNLLQRLTPLARPETMVSHRILPAQPANLPPGRIFAGVDLGLVEFDGPRPQPGDLVVILKEGGTTLCRSEQTVKGFTMPTFSSPCSCRCPANNGVAFYLAYDSVAAYVLAIDATTGTLLQVIAQNELGYGASLATSQAASLAVDNTAPYHLYVLDDRRGLATPQTDSSPTVRRGYMGIATYTVVSGQYQFNRYDGITDPYVPGPHDPINPSVEPDPPGVPLNCLSVVAGVPLVTMAKAPARYLSLTGGTFTTHTLTQNGSPSSLRLVGNIITVPDQPANKNNRYVLATDGSSYSLLQFNTSDAITKTVALTSTSPAVPKQLGSVCNRLLVLNASLDTFESSVLI